MVAHDVVGRGLLMKSPYRLRILFCRNCSFLLHLHIALKDQCLLGGFLSRCWYRCHRFVSVLLLASCILQHHFHPTCLGLTVPAWAKLGHATGWVHVLKGCTGLCVFHILLYAWALCCLRSIGSHWMRAFCLLLAPLHLGSKNYLPNWEWARVTDSLVLSVTHCPQGQVLCLEDQESWKIKQLQWRQEAQKFMVILGYIEGSRPTWETRDLVSKEINEWVNKQVRLKKCYWSLQLDLVGSNLDPVTLILLWFFIGKWLSLT